MMTPWDRAMLSAVLLVACPKLFGGVLVRCGQGDVLAAFSDRLTRLGPDGAAPLHIPSSVSADRLHRSLSVARTLAEGKPIYQSGLLEQGIGRVLVINGAERLDPHVSTALASALETPVSSGDGVTAMMAIDESWDDEGGVAPSLAERLAFRVELRNLRPQDLVGSDFTREDVARVRAHMSSHPVTGEDLNDIVNACVSLGIASLRAPIFCMHAAQGLAALFQHREVTADDISMACQLVLPGRGQEASNPTPRPQPDAETRDPETTEEPREDRPESEDAGSHAMETKIIDAVKSMPNMLSAPLKGQASRSRNGVSGRSGAHVVAFDRGRPDRPIQLKSARGRIDVLATLRAAAPLQKARAGSGSHSRLVIRKSDLRVKRFKRRKQSSVIFIVDASGSAAIARMSEAKGAVERLLSQCYARRDLVSLISFAGDQATLVLPPSRSLVRAQRQISDLAGGGATPLAHAIVEAGLLARSERDRGRTPLLVFLTDGRGNMTLEGQSDRQASRQQVSRLARTLIKNQFSSVFFDMSRRPDPRTRQLSEDLGAQYEFLPNVDGETVSRVVRDRIGTR